MYQSIKDHQLSDIYEKMVDILSESADSKLVDQLFSEDEFSLRSLSGNKATFVADSAATANIIKQAFVPTIKNALYQILNTQYEIEILDKNSFQKRQVAVEEANQSFFRNSSLQPNYTFDNFVIGTSNKNAYLASLFAVEQPAKSNPIFFYSKSGMGKTHLLQAIGNSYSEKHPEQKVLYITSEDFVSEFVRYVKGNKDSENLKDFFETVDVLLVDDIQFFAGKNETQMMFFNVFNLLVSHHKQIVLTSDRAPSELEGLQDRLVSRFSGGLSISIGNPNKDTLVEILKMKIRTNGLSVDLFDEEVLDYLAFNYSHNVRELEGAFTNLLFAITTSKPEGKINLSFTKSVFEADEERKQSVGKVTADTIIKVVADHYSLTEAQLRSKVRTSQIALARQIAMYLCRTFLSMPYQEIGKSFGKDHTTVLANVQKIQSTSEKDPILKKALDTLTEKLKQK